MKRVCVLLILSASLACVSPAVAQVDTDNDGLLDVMELPGFPSDIEFAAVEDLDGVNIFTNADELILQGNQLRIESGDFETLSNLRQLFLGSIVSWECWIERELVWVDESGHEQFELIEHCGPDRRVSVSRELSKKFEETRRGTAEAVHAHFEAHPPKGEFVVVVAGAEG